MKIARELDLALENLLVDRHGVVVVERVDSCDHLVGENAESPPIDGLAMAFVKENLGGEILGSSTEGVRAGLAVLCEAEVRQLEVALGVDEDVFGLQVTVDNVQRVQVLKHERHLARVKPATQRVSAHGQKKGSVTLALACSHDDVKVYTESRFHIGHSSKEVVL